MNGATGVIDVSLRRCTISGNVPFCNCYKALVNPEFEKQGGINKVHMKQIRFCFLIKFMTIEPHIISL